MDRVRAAHPAVDPSELLLLETALIETAGNAVEHGTPPGGLRYRFVLELGDDGLHGTFTDDGDPVTLPPDTGAPPDPLAESGRGIALARAALTELRYERQGDQNVWVLSRLVDAAAASSPG